MAPDTDLTTRLLAAIELVTDQDSSENPTAIDATPVRRQAADWLIRIADPECSKKQLRELDNWLASSEVHRLAFDELTTAWCSSPSSDATDCGSAMEAALSLRLRVLGLCLFFVGDTDDAEYLTQETYRRLLLMYRPNSPETCAMGPYLLRLATQVVQVHATGHPDHEFPTLQ